MMTCTARFIKQTLKDPEQDARMKCAKPVGHALTKSRRHKNASGDLAWDSGAEVDLEELLNQTTYCLVCHHPHGYHTTERGCTMPLDAAGLPVSRTSDTVRSCGCTTQRRDA